MNMRRRTRRQPSNIFEMFTQSQMGELRETFNFLDTNRDGLIGLEDLIQFSSSIGNPFMPEEIDILENEAKENGDYLKGMTFAMFLSLIGARLALTDDEKTLINAFKVFSDDVSLYENSNEIETKKELWVNKDLLKRYLTTVGDKLTEEEADLFLKGCIEKDNVDCIKLTEIIKHGEVLQRNTK